MSNSENWSGFDDDWIFDSHDNFRNFDFSSFENQEERATREESGSPVSFHCQQHHCTDLPSSHHALTQSAQQELNSVSSLCLNSFQNQSSTLQNTQQSDYTLLGCGYFVSELTEDLIDYQELHTNARLCDFTHHIVNRMLQRLSSSIKRKFSSLEIDEAVRYLPSETKFEIEKLYNEIKGKQQLVPRQSQPTKKQPTRRLKRNQISIQKPIKIHPQDINPFSSDLQLFPEMKEDFDFFSSFELNGFENFPSFSTWKKVLLLC
jgi:hypothetical protein